MSSPDPASLPIPGTLVLVDTDGRAAGPHAGRSDVILHPTPSADANDPLNWSTARKQIAFAMLMVYCITAGFAACSIYSVLVPLSDATGISLGDLNAGTGYMFLLLGWGGILTQPFAQTFGKRPTFIISQLGHLAIIVWQGYIHGPGDWYANKIIQGLLTSPIEMLVEISISDLFFAHERGLYMGLYSMALFGGNFLAPVWAGFVNDALGYRWVFWISAIQLAAGTLVLILFMEETNYNRGTTEISENHGDSGSTSEEKSDKDAHAASHDVVASDDRQLVGTPYGFVRRMAMFNDRWTTMRVFFIQMYRPLLFLRYPVVFWSGFLYGSSLIWYNVLNATASLIFTDVYNFRASAVGLTYLGPTLGAVLAAGYAGYAADKFLLWDARRKNGLREPEDRLWLLGLNALILPVGLILWGVGAAKHIHWFGLVVGGCLVAFTSASGGAFALNYVLDSYKDLGGEVVLSVILVRNTMSFAVSYGITPWVVNMGYQNAFIVAALVGMAVYLSFLPVIKWGKGWRKASRVSYWAYVRSSVMGH
ncbi:hypothetical protein Q8F55_008586 [Vanrija albida]|uniref:Major facilitator superfamily (MFS) profile domain-containing protein n=1 Tax=Vanrija albida TaxID=181172 RepID=A0ABR3PS86_9TREE